MSIFLGIFQEFQNNFLLETVTSIVYKMVKHKLKILQQMLQDFLTAVWPFCRY